MNWIIMDYLVSEGYAEAAEKFAQETNLSTPVDLNAIKERVRVRNAIHAGKVAEAIEMINEIDPEVSEQNISSFLRYDYLGFMHHSYPSLVGVDDIQLHFSPQYDHDNYNCSFPLLYRACKCG